MIVTRPAAKPEPLVNSVSTALGDSDYAWLLGELERQGMTKAAYLRRLVQIQRSLHVS